MVVQLEAYGLEARFWIASGYADNPPRIEFRMTATIRRDLYGTVYIAKWRELG
jgi:hypothetical protein